MTIDDMERLTSGATTVLRFYAPVKTGNLRNNGINYEVYDDKGVIYVDGDCTNGIAFYMPYTNEPWVADRWHGKKNPNEGWWQNAVDKVAEYIADILGGALIR